NKRVGIYTREYFDRAGQGLKDFDVQRHVSPQRFTRHVEANRAYYEKIRPQINKVVDQKPVIQAAFRKLKRPYPPTSNAPGMCTS
ncbi:MAG: hypothetical protein ACRESR_03700, partial [Gammaproteobacteria bacterium]